LKMCSIIGIMISVVTIVKVIGGIILPIPALITQLATFVVLASFAAYFDFKLYRNIKE